MIKDFTHRRPSLKGLFWSLVTLFLFLNAAAAESGVEGNSLEQNRESPENPSPEQQTTMLEYESVEQSLSRLTSINMFYSPGPIEPGSISFDPPAFRPLSEKAEWYTVDVITGNRRVLKLYSDLREMPADKSSDLVERRLRELLAEYRKYYAAESGINNPKIYLKETFEASARSPSQSTTGVGFIVRTPDPNAVTLSGLRYSVLSLVWLAGVLGLHDAHDAIREVAEEAAGQRDIVYGDDIHHDLFKESLLKYLSLYNRTVLGSALLSTMPNRLLLLKLPEQREKLRLSSFDATRTAVDLMGLPDLSHGEIEYEYYPGITDPIFDEILAASREQ